jgi:Double zinc ribbon
MTDLERFFRRLVSNAAAAGPHLLRAPLPLADIPVTIMPYRSNRRALGLDSSEEYEMVLLRLCAGEGGFVRTEPEEVRQKLVDEVGRANPDLEELHRYEDVMLVLHPGRVEQALLHHTMELEHVTPTDEAAEEQHLDPAPEEPGSQCVYCGGALPHRPVNFCPHCGQSQVAMMCPDCHADVEPGWRHCVNCGVALGPR